MVVGIHAWVEDLVASLTRGPDGTYGLPARALSQFEKAATEVASGAELFAVLTDLVKLASVLSRELASPEAASGVFRVADGLATRLEQLAAAEGASDQTRAEQIQKQIAKGRDALQAPRAHGAFMPPVDSGVSLRKR